PDRSPAGPDDSRARRRARRDRFPRGRAHRCGRSPHLLGHLFGHGRRRPGGAEARGLGNVEFGVMDAQALELPDCSVGPVLSRFGVMLAPDPARVVREARRVLRDGGRLAYAVWGPPDRNPWLTLFVGAFLQTGHVPPGGDPIGPSGVFSLGA